MNSPQAAAIAIAAAILAFIILTKLTDEKKEIPAQNYTTTRTPASAEVNITRPGEVVCHFGEGDSYCEVIR